MLLILGELATRAGIVVLVAGGALQAVELGPVGVVLAPCSLDLAVDLKAKTNARRITHPRQVAMYLAKKLSGESLPAIGQMMGGKHHTTVLHSVRKVAREIREDPAIDKLVARLTEQLGA